MSSITQLKFGVGAIIIALFLILAPVPFLSAVTQDSQTIRDIPNTVLRLGQNFAQPKLVEIGLHEPILNAKTLKIEGVPFSVEIEPGVSSDELEAIVGSVVQPEVQTKYMNAKRLVFAGWEPNYLPLRIGYRYFLLGALILLCCGAYLLATRQK